MASQAEVLRFPATVVQRMLKDALPTEACVSKEARTAFGRAAAVFILNMATHANDFATSRKRKMITGDDVFHAIKTLECDKLEKPLKEALDLWKIAKTQKAEETKRRKSEKAVEVATEDLNMDSYNNSDDINEAPEESQGHLNASEHGVRDIEDM